MELCHCDMAMICSFTWNLLYREVYILLFLLFRYLLLLMVSFSWDVMNFVGNGRRVGSTDIMYIAGIAYIKGDIFRMRFFVHVDTSIIDFGLCRIPLDNFIFRQSLHYHLNIEITFFPVYLVSLWVCISDRTDDRLQHSI